MDGGAQCQTETGERVTVLVPGERTDGRFALIEMTVGPSSALPLHAHTREDEVIYVLRGEITVHADGASRSCPAGSCVLLPREREHTFRVESDEATLLVLLLPAGLEGHYQELDRSLRTERHIERLIAASARYGVEIVGPSPTDARDTTGMERKEHTTDMGPATDDATAVSHHSTTLLETTR
jgi:quercetin dioxygenase-like cupin family protein